MAGLTRLQQQEKSLQALAVVLQHPVVAADQRTICTLLRVSKAWSTAVDQSAASTLDCNLTVQISLNQLSQVIRFGGWLAKHAGLVRTLKIRRAATSRDSAALMPDIKQLLGSALQVAAYAPARDGLAPLRLQSYSCSVPATAGLLAALPAATLTHLDLEPDNSNWFSALSRLANLQQLRMGMSGVQPGTVNSCLREIGKLQQLTQLQLEYLASESDMQFLPRELQTLQLQYSGWSRAKDVHVNLHHLTSLQHLQLRAGNLSIGSALPVNLQSLELHAHWPAGWAAGFSSMHQVTAIELTGRYTGRDHLEALQHLPQLESLSLSLEYLDHPLEVAAVWHSLPLCSLSILNRMMTATMLQQLMQHVATATKLTKLEVVIKAVRKEGDGLAICEHLKALQHLSSLRMSIGEPTDFVEHDTQHLSALTTLTSLELSSGGSGPHVDEASLCCLALSLTGLRSLVIDADVDQSDVEDSIISALPVIGRLTKLEELAVRGLPCDEARRGLRFLTGLCRLTLLQGFKYAGEAALQEFRAIITGLQQQCCW